MAQATHQVTFVLFCTVPFIVFSLALFLYVAKNFLKIVEKDGKKWMHIHKLNGKSIYMLLEKPQAKMGWNEAKKWCEERGGYLPRLDTLCFMVSHVNIIKKRLAVQGIVFDEEQWSAMEHENDFYAFIVDAAKGEIDKRNKDYFYGCAFMCFSDF